MSSKVYAIVLRYLVTSEVVDAVRPAHVVFLDRGYQEGVFLTSGRQTPPTGGFILARAVNRAWITAYMHQDPFYTQGCAELQIFEFEPNKASVEMQFLLDL